MNNLFEAEKFELDPTFENTINDIKDSNMKRIAYAATNPPAITPFDKDFIRLLLATALQRNFLI